MASGVQLVDRNGDPLTTVNGALSVSQNHGKYYDQAQDNRVYVGTSLTAGIALIVAATSGNHPTLWNPAGSGRVVSLISLHLAYISGANAPGSLAWNHTLDAGAQVGTAGAILTGTKVAVQNANIGGPVGSKVPSPGSRTTERPGRKPAAVDTRIFSHRGPDRREHAIG